ncbi:MULTISPECIES: MarR family winged helix-turn-helix transcriptional regulator [Mycobacteriaceae]|uniref:MarR family transcriptional regulator n=1 Tax=Mycolicibacterium neoaurum VKM Ac-1815D TaxID=700508 RepID=V5XHE6_MYCNE|nr:MULTISPECIES: MarR family transcriptional regulator [Mycobacteriaceae]AHC27248.1 MarR family transcriptional regulator [Mycolicibacterium neoaurum VKM Ac-1815D]AMO07486.1 MarR family transcriptional regulator [Mycolicibacterium neoaurum]AXK74124.1 transcriptional regulator [Mycolicibacterium neoaurum]KJQ51441.1 MarR family transcriptional regulator [Mycolicibacterium neoaurum]KUM09239.1 MarR family transcriptional regulator [Mycolicibacterium neoaurum]
MSDRADDVWRLMSSIVINNQDTWKRAVVERTGLPFSRIRIISRLANRALSVKEIADAATIDAPAATVAVNDLAKRGLVIRETDPDNRRCKKVSLTDAGRELLVAIDSVDNPAPDLMRSLSDADLSALQEILHKATRG